MTIFATIAYFHLTQNSGISVTMARKHCFFRFEICARAAAFALVCGAAVLPAGRALAAFSVCNQSFDVANVAMGQQVRGRFETRGWWKIGPNQCAEVVRDRLANRFVYVFATDVFGKELLAGSVPMCVGTDRFVIEGEADCLVRGHLQARFIEVDTQDNDSWTLFLTPLPE